MFCFDPSDIVFCPSKKFIISSLPSTTLFKINGGKLSGPVAFFLDRFLRYLKTLASPLL